MTLIRAIAVHMKKLPIRSVHPDSTAGVSILWVHRSVLFLPYTAPTGVNDVVNKEVILTLAIVAICY